VVVYATSLQAMNIHGVQQLIEMYHYLQGQAKMFVYVLRLTIRDYGLLLLSLFVGVMCIQKYIG